MDDVRQTFKDPPAAYRGKPFWAWNGRLEEGELRRQIRVMHRMGLGGFFMHSRVGLATEYLSDEWFRMVEACIDEAERLGMEAWLYDEDRWPSGAAGGLVTTDPRYRHKNLAMLICGPGEARFEHEPLALFSARTEGNTARDVRRLGPDWDGTVEPEDASILAFFVVADEPSSWFNDATYLDTMSHEAVRRFLEVTHEAYRDRVGGHFGAAVPGIFTDEPHHGGLFSRVPLEGAE
ncbi:MAG: glycosyl hydrolase, partial [Planctomycetota bacterium]